MNRLSIITHLSDKEQMLIQYEILIQEYRNQPNSINIIAICLNNIRALLNKNELLSKSIFRFIKQHLLKALSNALQFIIFMNTAKTFKQLGLHGKAFYILKLHKKDFQDLKMKILLIKENSIGLNELIKQKMIRKLQLKQKQKENHLK